MVTGIVKRFRAGGDFCLVGRAGGGRGALAGLRTPVTRKSSATRKPRDVSRGGTPQGRRGPRRRASCPSGSRMPDSTRSASFRMPGGGTHRARTGPGPYTPAGVARVAVPEVS